VWEDMWLRVGGGEGVSQEINAIEGGSDAHYDTIP